MSLHFHELKVAAVEPDTEEAVIVRFDVPAELREVFAFTQGQYLTLRAMVDGEDLRRTGSAALDLAYVACGRLDGYFEFGLQPWDVAAGALLVREAGGVVLDFEGEDGWFDSGNVIAGNLKVAAAMVARIKPLAGKRKPISEEDAG